MNPHLRNNYESIKAIYKTLTEDHVVVFNLNPLLAKAWVYTEVPRYAAAKLIHEGKVRVGTAEEVVLFRENRKKMTTINSLIALCLAVCAAHGVDLDLVEGWDK